MEPSVRVGIVSDRNINFVLHDGYFFHEKWFEGNQNISFEAGKIRWNDKLYHELVFEPENNHSSFTLKDVIIGVNFHWERKEDQRFHGILKFIIENEQITAINIIKTEAYLTSVISSEMSSNASPELLKAHAVISRSWLLKQIENNKTAVAINRNAGFTETETERIRWYDREDHANFDVCADDHCQRYQGISRVYDNFERVKQAVESTRGEILVHENRICDARFSKCCGGVTEEFQNCWENTKYSYLVSLCDTDKSSEFYDLTLESEAIKWINARPESFCNTDDKYILSQILNNYDQETADFYRWSVSYSRHEISALIAERSGIDFGIITELIPLERGASGRIVKLKIVGTQKTMTIGKELEIRKILSKSHLYSSAFYVEMNRDTFTLHGAGWGHGTGLCQIGAAVMSEHGYTYTEILQHYYNNAEIKRWY
ncbi:MAG: SpoIID/LytB domain-containing protein [Cytophagaceae bacterium]|jgi:SpoIID/LytB domain protein|nr:SpoIID/LytB domain-containing protein [Cytophagaceae bacterium]